MALEAWRKSSNKDNLSHYQSDQLRVQYVKHEMPKRIKDSRKWLSQPVRRLLQLRPTETQLRLLSLGCGPGSDLLAGIKCLLAQGLRADATVSCTGVDLVSWDRTSFNRKVSQLRGADFASLKIETEFHKEDMRTFVRKCLPLLPIENGTSFEASKFDLISLSYANAKETLQDGLAKCLPRLLRPGGSVVIIDNTSPNLQRLAKRNPQYKKMFCKNKGKLVLVCKAKLER